MSWEAFMVVGAGLMLELDVRRFSAITISRLYLWHDQSTNAVNDQQGRHFEHGFDINSVKAELTAVLRPIYTYWGR
jgi:hypothetical protein